MRTRQVTPLYKRLVIVDWWDNFVGETKMAKKSPSSYINSNGIELHERMVRIETKIDSIKETLDKVVSWQTDKAKQLEEHEKFISSQKQLNKVWWFMISTVMVILLGLLVRHAVEIGRL